MTFDTDDIIRQNGYSEGDIIPLYSARYTSAYSTSNSSYTRVTSPDNTVTFPFDRLDGPGRELGVAFTGALKNDTSGATTFARLEVDFSAKQTTEVSVTGTSAQFRTSSLTNGVPSDPARVDIQMKVSSGTGTLEGNVSAAVFLKL